MRFLEAHGARTTRRSRLGVRTLRGKLEEIRVYVRVKVVVAVDTKDSVAGGVGDYSGHETTTVAKHRKLNRNVLHVRGEVVEQLNCGARTHSHRSFCVFVSKK